MKIRIEDIKELDFKEQVTLKVVVKNLKEIDTTGRNYNQTLVTLADLTGETVFPMWKPLSVVEDELKLNRMYKVQAVIKNYKGEKQLDFKTAQILDDTEENRKSIDPTYYKKLLKENKKKFVELLDSKFTDNRYKRLVEVAFGLRDVPKGTTEDEYNLRRKTLLNTWASINHHDNYDGGLFNHIIGILRMLEHIQYQYGEAIGRAEKTVDIDWNYLYLLAFTHDIDKAREYKLDEDSGIYGRNPDFNYTHIETGGSTLAVYNSQLEDPLSYEEMSDVIYGILCHHGEYGNYPIKKHEDKILNSLDILDSTLVDTLIL